jgi:hypothetical protein
VQGVCSSTWVTLDIALAVSAGDIGTYERGIDNLSKRRVRTDENKNLQAEFQKLRDSAEKLNGVLNLLTSNDSREIGHVFYAPAYVLEDAWLQDWVLIKLRKDRYTTMLKGLPNAVWLGSLSP